MSTPSLPNGTTKPVLSPEEVTTSGPYWYSRPDWGRSIPVEVEDGEGDYAGEKRVRFNRGVVPTLLKRVPADARFQMRDDHQPLEDKSIK